MSYIGANKIGGMYLGSTEIKKAYLGGDLVYQKSGVTPSLPYDAEVEYLESTGHQLIDTQYYPNPLTTIEMVIQFIEIGNSGSSSAKNNLLGTRDTGNASFNVNFGGSSGQSRRVFVWNDKKYGQGGDVRYTDISIENKGTFSIAPDEFRFCNTVLALAQKTTTSDTSLYLLGASMSDYFNRWGIRLFSVKITEGNNVVAYMIPVRMGAVGFLYDTVNQKSLQNLGDANFVLGNDIT